MIRYTITFYPGKQQILIPEGNTVRDAIRAAGMDFEFPCGGEGLCGKCRVKILNYSLPPTASEMACLSPCEIETGIRLACFTVIGGDLEIELPGKGKASCNTLMKSESRSVNIEPLLQKIYVECPPPSNYDQRSDWQRLKDSLARKSGNDLEIEIPVLRTISQTLRASRYRVTAITDGSEVYGLEGMDTTALLLGMAFDIGTTTIVGYLMDLQTGKEMAVVSALNPQVKYGADVMTRINLVIREENGLEELQSLVVGIIDRLIGEAAAKAGVDRNDIYVVTVVGNTCMHHIFAGLNPRYIGLAPYVSVTGDYLSFNAGAFHLNINSAGKVFLFPNIAGFVGGDTVAVILATGMDQSSDIKLAVDIGTNGEIVLGSSQRMVSCSAAAGPAFEGAQISSGMIGAAGAIDHVDFGERITYSVIGGVKPKGICGSGLLDAAAGLIKAGIINERGKILSGSRISNPAGKVLAGNIIEHEGANAFRLVDNAAAQDGGPILITQSDITALQLAKGAIAAGIKILLKELNLKPADVKEVLLAGAFGNYLDTHSACAIGLIPRELESKIRPVGNAAGSGAKLALLSRGEFERAARIAAFVKYLELAVHPDFTAMFARSLSFL